jgi:hypothetical protein
LIFPLGSVLILVDHECLDTYQRNALAGILSGGDRYGLLLSIAPKLHLFDGV